MSKREVILKMCPGETLETLNNFGVYKLTNKKNSKFYIGSTQRDMSHKRQGFSIRFGEHINTLIKGTHCNLNLQRAFDKTPDLKNWVFEILEICKKEDCIAREQYYLDTLLFAQEHNKDKKDRRFVNLGYNISTNAFFVTAKKSCKKVYQYDLKGNFIKKWNSIKDVSIHFNVAETNVSKACRIGTSCKNYLWSYLKLKKIVPKSKKKKQEEEIEHYLFTITGTFIMKFNFISESIKYIKDTFNKTIDRRFVIRCLSGKRMSTGDFIWKMKPEVDLFDVCNNAVMFKNKKFIKVYPLLYSTGYIISWNTFYNPCYGYIKRRDGIEIFKRTTIETSTDINFYYSLLPQQLRTKKKRYVPT